MTLSELQTSYFLKTQKEPTDENGNFTDEYVSYLQDILLGKTAIYPKELAEGENIVCEIRNYLGCPLFKTQQHGCVKCRFKPC